MDREGDGPRGDIVLVVEDSPENLAMVTEALAEAGMTPLVAVEGEAALDLLREVTPDIVLMDAVLPGPDGFETCRRMKADSNLAHVPVIFMTGLADTEHILSGLAAGGVDYVTKPIVPSELIARIRVHLANARLSRSAHLALDVTGRYLLAVDGEGELVWHTPEAQRLLPRGGPAAHGEGERLPDALRAWVRQRIGADGTQDNPILDVAGPEGALRFTYLGGAGRNEYLLRISRLNAASQESILRERLSLTARESEVLLWIARGKANKDIAAILGLSPRTVNKHLEQIYAKLGVENRSSAAALAVRVLAVEA